MAVQRGNSAAVLGKMGQQTLAGKGDHSNHMMASNQMYFLCVLVAPFSLPSPTFRCLCFIFLSFVYPVALILCVM